MHTGLWGPKPPGPTNERAAFSEKTSTLGTPSHLACLTSWTGGAAQHLGQMFHVVFSAASTLHLGAVPTRILGEYLQAGLVSNRTETLPALPWPAAAPTNRNQCEALFLRGERDNGAECPYRLDGGHRKISSPQSSTARKARNTSSCWWLSRYV